MPFDKTFWKDIYFSELNKPVLICPTCKTGHLQIEMNSFKVKPSAHTQKHRDDDDWNIQDSERVFSGIIQCQNKLCGEHLAVCGIEVIEPELVAREEHALVIQLLPKYFYPSLEVFPLKPSYPKKIREQLQLSFALYFCDITSSANKIRICIEVLMNELGVSESKETKKGNVLLSLGERINIYSHDNPTIAARLSAIKWIGNSGSHFDSLERDDLLDAYEILVSVLDKLFDDHDKYLDDKVHEINAARKPLSKTKPKFTTKGIKE